MGRWLFLLRLLLLGLFFFLLLEVVGGIEVRFLEVNLFLLVWEPSFLPYS